MDGQVLIFPRANDVQVKAQFPQIPDGTGMSAKFYYKDNRYTLDADITTHTYTSTIVADPSSPGATMSTFSIPGTDNGVTGAFWWRIDVIDAGGKVRTASAGTLLVEAA